MIHGCKITGVNEAYKPNTKVDGTDKDWFQFFCSHKIPEFHTLIFNRSLLKKEKG